jgi:hypothetical protein
MTRDEKKPSRYLKVAAITVIVAGVAIGGAFGVIHDKDRMELDIQKLKRSIGIANALHFEVTLDEGSLAMKRRGVKVSRTIEIPTLKTAVFADRTVRITFESWFFSQTIALDRTAALRLPHASD